MQIEMKVIEGLKVGNDCLKSMHEVSVSFLFGVSTSLSFFPMEVHTVRMSKFFLIGLFPVI